MIISVRFKLSFKKVDLQACPTGLKVLIFWPLSMNRGILSHQGKRTYKNYLLYNRLFMLKQFNIP
jgi:hypothetical protein